MWHKTISCDLRLASLLNCLFVFVQLTNILAGRVFGRACNLRILEKLFRDYDLVIYTCTFNS